MATPEPNPGDPRELRLRQENDAPFARDGDYVLYWMIAARRPRHNLALERALAHARELGRPLLVFEPLRAGYRWASRRFHQIVVDGMAHNGRAFAEAGVGYYPYVEPAAGDGRGLLAALAERACLVVADRHPGFHYPPMLAAAAAQCPVRLESVDGCGILPLAAAPRAFTTAASFRRFLQSCLAPHLEVGAFPRQAPLDGIDAAVRGAVAPEAVSKRWPAASEALLADDGRAWRAIEIPAHDAPGPEPEPVARESGWQPAEARLADFLSGRASRYHADRNAIDDGAASGLSTDLHWGHLSSHQLVREVLDSEGFETDQLGKVTGSRQGWWGLSEPAEALLDQVITWRELGHVHVDQIPDDTRYETLPDWALTTLHEHAGDERPHRYSLEQLARAETHDELWNAAQRQLLREGVIHNYLRMLWGKKILEWSPTPAEACQRLFELNNRYAIDGRDPNSTSGIMWTLGRFDRAWGPEREIFGKVRYMSSPSARRKLKLDAYLERFGG